MASRRIFYGLALIEGLVFYVAYQEWFSWILLLVLLFFPLLSLILSLGAVWDLRLEPTAPARIPLSATDVIDVTVSVKHPQPPTKTRLRVFKPITGESWILKPGDKLPTAHCGGLTARLYKPRVFDYLGLFSFPVRRSPSQTFLVLPEPVSMDIPPELTRYLARAWRPKPGGGYAENHEMRQYRPGDNLNQIHWKLSAKVGELMLREPMEPERGLMLLTMDLCGTPQALDTKFGQLLWLGNWLLSQDISFEVRALSGNGIEARAIRDASDLQKCIDTLLCAPFASEGSIRDRDFTAAWQHYIGGERNEA